MSQNIEVEFKNMLTKAEYEQFLKKFMITETQIFSQENHYFDTADFALMREGSALRIRQKRGSYEMTLKQPATIGLLETNQNLSKNEALLAIEHGNLPTGIIQRLIEEYGISFSQLVYFGSLKTNRVEWEYKKGLLVLDHSIYLKKEDYELEYEVEDFQAGQQIFLELLHRLEIPKRNTENKIRRFYNQKQKQQD